MFCYIGTEGEAAEKLRKLLKRMKRGHEKYNFPLIRFSRVCTFSRQVFFGELNHRFIILIDNIIPEF